MSNIHMHGPVQFYEKRIVFKFAILSLSNYMGQRMEGRQPADGIPQAIKRACEQFDPSQVAKYVVDLAQAFNKYYGEVKILEESEEQQARLALVYAVTVVLKEGLRLLGVEAPEEM